MKGMGFRIGSADYKNRQLQICDEWSRMSLDEKQGYERLAAEQTAVRSQMASKCLADLQTNPQLQQSEFADHLFRGCRLCGRFR